MQGKMTTKPTELEELRVRIAALEKQNADLIAVVQTLASKVPGPFVPLAPLAPLAPEPFSWPYLPWYGRDTGDPTPLPSGPVICSAHQEAQVSA